MNNSHEQFHNVIYGLNTNVKSVISVPMSLGGKLSYIQ